MNHEENYWINLGNQNSRQAEQEHEYRIAIVAEQVKYNLFALLKPKVTVDGNMYCIAYGDDPMEGVYGYGETIEKAVIEWNKEFHKPLPTRKA